MAVSSNLEMRFVELRKEIERYASISDYAQTKALIEKAMPLCSRIYSETKKCTHIARVSSAAMRK